MGLLWTLIIGFLAGVIAKFLHPGPNEPSGFVVTTLLGVAGALPLTWGRLLDGTSLVKVRG
jgi:uncharacterized membrane protein YeaQ/YmgE (transglycosylase-associated protein family)